MVIREWAFLALCLGYYVSLILSVLEANEGRAMKWINIKDELPPEYSHILIYIPQFVNTKNFMTTTIYLNCLDSLQGATHWMHLPALPPVEA